MEIKSTDFFEPLKLNDTLTWEDYKKAEMFIRSAEAFSLATHHSVYIIDYYKQGFFYVSENPLFLCGESAKKVRQMGYDFYLNRVPKDDLEMLLEINEAGFSFYNSIALHNRLKYSISYDFHMIQANQQLLLINHKLMPLALDKQSNIWLALCVVSHSSRDKAGNIIISWRGGKIIKEYDLPNHKWIDRKKPKLSEKEKQVLAFSIQGFSMEEIADKMYISVSTIKFHKKNIFRKLDVRNISEAISCASNYTIF